MEREDQRRKLPAREQIEQGATEHVAPAQKRGRDTEQPRMQQRRAAPPVFRGARRSVHIRRALTSPAALRQAVVVAEVLGPPAALRPSHQDRSAP